MANDNSTVQLQFIGAAGTVTGSKTILKNQPTQNPD
jgi:hypothetical protein